MQATGVRAAVSLLRTLLARLYIVIVTHVTLRMIEISAVMHKILAWVSSISQKAYEPSFADNL